MTPRRIFEVSLPNAAIIESVRESCAGLPAGSTRLAECFYANLFAMAPDMRDMFPEDLRAQRQRMADALVEVVRYLDSPDHVARYLQKLGAQHYRALGVRPEHYPFVGRALVRAVSEVSPTWTSSMSSAWVMVYEWITANMLAGAEYAASGASGAPRQPGTSRAGGAPGTPGPSQTYGVPQSSGPSRDYDIPRPYGASSTTR